MTATLLWLRQDLRLGDQPALVAAVAEGAVVPVYILDDVAPGAWQIGAAQRWWLHHSLAALDASFKKRGASLILRHGKAADVLRAAADEMGIRRVHAMAHYEPWHKEAEASVAESLQLVLHDGNYLSPPDRVRTAQGERYRIFSPWYRRLVESLPLESPLLPPEKIPSPGRLPKTRSLADLDLLPNSPDWSWGFSQWQPGEQGAWEALGAFLRVIDRYEHERDAPSQPATSRLSAHLHFGEISPRSVWHAIQARRGGGPATFRSQLAWREHGINLVDQLPDYPERNGRQLFDGFHWRQGREADDDFRVWTKGMTGYPVVDAGMRQLWKTGWMHNRVRMITASFLVKHLLIDWRRGERWFWDTLIDADLGANAMNWQYVAGTGVDAPVFSRIMSPRVQSEKFAMADYIRAFVPELARLSDKQIYEAHFRGAGVAGYPPPIVSHEVARARALTAWHAVRG